MMILTHEAGYCASNYFKKRINKALSIESLECRDSQLMILELQLGVVSCIVNQIDSKIGRFKDQFTKDELAFGSKGKGYWDVAFNILECEDDESVFYVQQISEMWWTYKSDRILRLLESKEIPGLKGFSEEDYEAFWSSDLVGSPNDKPRYIPFTCSGYPFEEPIRFCLVRENLESCTDESHFSVFSKIEDMLDGYRQEAKKQLAQINKKKSSLKLEKQREDDLYGWLRMKDVDVHRQVQTSSKHILDLWIPGEMVIELKRNSVTANDVCQCIEYWSEYDLPIILVGDKITTAASQGLNGFNKLAKGKEITFVTWNILRDYLLGKLIKSK